MTALCLPRVGLDAVMHDLESFGRDGTESIAFGLGRRQDGVATVMSVVLAEEPGITRRFGLLRLSERWMLKLTELCESLEQAVVMQFHSHPEEAWHSDTDDHHLFHAPGIFSVVVPDFAQSAAARDQSAWAVYRCANGGAFEASTPTAVDVTDGDASLIIVSEDGWRHA
ncbi:MAG TPA: hypothetical protein VGA13_06485 [Acidimicrobiales bacterium]